jgi:hypothetical protein
MRQLFEAVARVGALWSCITRHGHPRLADSGGRAGAGGPTFACAQTMTGLHHAFSALRTRVPHRTSLSRAL